MESQAVAPLPQALAPRNDAPPPAALAPRKPEHLISPVVDFLMIGGASLLLYLLAVLFVDASGNTYQISWTAYKFAFIVNNPHFMASYALLYWDKRSELLQRPRYIWAGVVVPVLLLAFFLYATQAMSPQLLGFAQRFMLFTVGWHYVKQIYGASVVTSARRGYYFSKYEAWILKGSLFPLWAISFFGNNLTQAEFKSYGISYTAWGFPQWTAQVSLTLVAILSLILVGMLGRKWLKTGLLPGAGMMAAIAAIYVWYLPQTYHAIYWYTIPFFHSLQYLLFVIALKRNETNAQAALLPQPEAQRWYFLKHCGGWMLCCVVTALLSFHLIPNWLDRSVAYNRDLFGDQLFMFCFITFINIHHYFVDNVLWRRDNEALKRYL